MAKPKISLIHPTGNPFAKNAAIALWELGMLRKIVTTFASDPSGSLATRLQKLPPPLARPLLQELGRRTWTAPTGTVLQQYPWREILRVAIARLGWHSWGGMSRQRWVDWVYASLDRQVAKHHLQGLRAIYAYEDGAADTFTAAKQQGIRCIYDLPIVFYRRSLTLQAEEAERFPDLAPALLSLQEPPWKLERKEREVQLADRIIVPSSTVKRSLLQEGIEAEKIAVIPFGAPIDYFFPKPKRDRQFRALFVGRLGPRKGVHYLLQAWQNLNLPNAELLCIGLNEFPPGWLGQYEGTFRYIASVPHSTLSRYYQQASVFVFPSLIEGLALVLLEAMACGIPIITTANAGGSDIITDGKEGFLIPIRDVEALQAKLDWCDRHPQELAEMGRAARRKAEQLTWELYRQRLAAQVLAVL